MSHRELRTVVEALDAAQLATSHTFSFADDRGAEHPWSFPELSDETRKRAACFEALGLKKGDRVGMIVASGEEFVLSFLAALRAGIVPVPMYPPFALGKLDAYVDVAAQILVSSGAKMLLASKKMSPVLWSLTARAKLTHGLVSIETLAEESKKKSPEDFRAVNVSPKDIAFLQYTSGSTAAPKGVMVTHQNLIANAHAQNSGIGIDPETDFAVSWLPLYHDMGLIGFVVTPLVVRVNSLFIPTMSFVRRPAVWMSKIHEKRGTRTFAPNFAFGLAAKRKPNIEGLDLSCLKLIGCGAEPINPETLNNFINAFEPHGLNPNVIMPAYGMAEATLAISFDSPHERFKTVHIDRDSYEEKQQAVNAGKGSDQTLAIVSCGKTFPGHQVAIHNDADQPVTDGHVGEIVFKGPSVTPGYFENKAASQELLRGGWLHTGDLGFILDGDLFVSGRKKDLIILAGRNYYPQAIEWEVEQVDGVRKGNAVAFSVPGEGTEELVVAFERKQSAPSGIEQTVIKHVAATLGLAVKHAVCLEAGQLPKTSSGKVQRQKTKQAFVQGRLGEEGVRTAGGTGTKMTLAKHVTRSAVARFTHGVRNTLGPRSAN